MTELTESHQSPFKQPPPRSKDPIKEAKGLSYNIDIALLDIASFRKWAEYGTPRAKPRNVNIRVLINRLSNDINFFSRQFQEHIKVFHLKAQVWKVKLKNCLESSKVGLIIYSAHTLHVYHLIKNSVKDIERENKK